MKIYPYNPVRVAENKAGSEPITEKQLEYILRLSKDRPIFDEVMDSIPEWKTELDYDLQKLSKGHAMYVIKCLLGQIQPVEITDDIRKRING